MVAVLGAFRSWQDETSQQCVVLFTDSEAVRGSSWIFLKKLVDSDRLMDVIFDIEAGFDLPIWIERAPSQSNPADVFAKASCHCFRTRQEVVAE